MALYLGGERLAVTLTKEIAGGSSNMTSGTVTADESGIVTFPQLSFTPKLIALWNIAQRDLKAEAEDNGEEWDENYIRYIHEGLMIFAVYQGGTWISQGMSEQSGGMYISNASILKGSCISEDDGVYSYRISCDPSSIHGANETFNYIICG